MWLIPPPLPRENRNWSLEIHVSLKFFICKMGWSILVQTPLCPKHPETTWKGFILPSIYLGFRRKKKNNKPAIKERISLKRSLKLIDQK